MKTPGGCWTCGAPKLTRRHFCAAHVKTERQANCEKQRTYKALHPDRKLVIYARSSAKTKGLECTLRMGDLTIPKTCPVLGIPLFFTPGKRTDNTPSVDRRDNTKGYVKENVLVVSWRANNLKRDASFSELIQLATFYSNPGEQNVTA